MEIKNKIADAIKKAVQSAIEDKIFDLNGELPVVNLTVPPKKDFGDFATNFAMQTAKIFNTGRSQAVRLPKSFEFDSQEVIIKHFGNGVLLLPKKKNAWL